MQNYMRVPSPLLHVTPFVGKTEPHKIQEGKPWLWNDVHGFSFCVGGINEAFGSFADGECVRIEIAKRWFKGSVAYEVHDACNISGLADRMLGQLFGFEVGSNDFDRAVLEHHMMTQDGVIDTDLLNAYTDDEVLPGVIFYCVRRV